MKGRWFLLIVALMVVTPAMASSPTVELEDAGDIEAARELDDKLDQLIAKVRQCAAAGLAPADQCYCQYPSKLNAARSTYEEMLDRNPNWEDSTLLWWEGNRPYPSNLQMRGLKVRFAQPCS